MFSSVYLTPVFAQRLLGFTPTNSALLLLPGAMLAIAGLMLSAKLLQKGLSTVYLIGAGIFSFIFFSWQMSRLNLAADHTAITIALIFRALGLAIITVPLTTLAVSSLQPQDLPQGAALNNMMRQIGGTFGLAVVNTFLHIRTAEHRSDIVSHLTLENPVAVDRLKAYTKFFCSHSSGTMTAYQQALQTLDNTVSMQSSQLSFSDAYLLVGLIFLIAVPILFLVTRRKTLRFKSVFLIIDANVLPAQPGKRPPRFTLLSTLKALT